MAVSVQEQRQRELGSIQADQDRLGRQWYKWSGFRWWHRLWSKKLWLQITVAQQAEVMEESDAQDLICRVHRELVVYAALPWWKKLFSRGPRRRDRRLCLYLGARAYASARTDAKPLAGFYRTSFLPVLQNTRFYGRRWYARFARDSELRMAHRRRQERQKRLAAAVVQESVVASPVVREETPVPVEQESVTAVPVNREPVAQEPVVASPVVREETPVPVEQESAAAAPVNDEPVEAPVAQESVVASPVVREETPVPVEQESAAAAPVNDEPVEASVAQESVVASPVVREETPVRVEQEPADSEGFDLFRRPDEVHKTVEDLRAAKQWLLAAKQQAFVLRVYAEAVKLEIDAKKAGVARPEEREALVQASEIGDWIRRVAPSLTDWAWQTFVLVAQIEVMQPRQNKQEEVFRQEGKRLASELGEAVGAVLNVSSQAYGVAEQACSVAATVVWAWADAMKERHQRARERHQRARERHQRARERHQRARERHQRARERRIATQIAAVHTCERRAMRLDELERELRGMTKRQRHYRRGAVWTETDIVRMWWELFRDARIHHVAHLLSQSLIFQCLLASSRLVDSSWLQTQTQVSYRIFSMPRRNGGLFDRIVDSKKGDMPGQRRK